MAPMKAMKVMKVAMKVVALTVAMKSVLTMKKLESAKGNTSMSLTDKLELWKKKNNINEPLELETSDQKRLSGRFQTALEKAPATAKKAWQDACESPPGLRNEP